MTAKAAKSPVPQTGFLDQFEILETLGQGTFGIVKRCRNKKTKEEFAVKIIRSRVLNARIENETKICSQLQHPNIVRLHNTFQDDMQYYMIFDLITGGELFDDIVKREYYSELEASRCIQQILEAVAYCHDNNIIHRDIKPENLLLKNEDPRANIKLANFGLALKVHDDSPGDYKIAGTLGYFSPEIVKKEKYGKSVDVWACGVILYILMVGYPPFWDDDEKRLSNLIAVGKYEFYSPEWDPIADDTKSLIDRMLQINPAKRLTAKEALKIPWILDPENHASKIHRQSTIEGLNQFNARRKLKSAIISTMCTRRFSMILNEKVKSPTSCTVNLSKLDFTKESTFYHEMVTLTTKLSEAIITNNIEVINSLSAPNCTKIEQDKPLYSNSVQVTIVSPNVRNIGENAACVSYTKLIQDLNKENQHVTKQFSETRIWESIEGSWKCVHLHSSTV